MSEEDSSARLPDELVAFARQLRRQQTDAEELVWKALRARRFAGMKFRRQHPLGRYVLDFYCHEARLAVELDGGQHNAPAAREKDAARSQWLARADIRVLRFWNHQVLEDTEAVFEVIYREVMERRER